MRVQIFEPFAGGHHTEYVAFLLPELVRLLDAGRIEKIVLTTTSRHRESSAFADSLLAFEPKVTFDVVPAGDIYHSGSTVASILLDSIKRNRPDFVVSTSADNGALPLALRTLLRSDFRARRITSAGVFHYGSHEGVRGVRNRARDAALHFAQRFSPWSERHFVNPLLYEYTARRAGLTDGRAKLLPHPVARKPLIAKPDARRSLGIPVDGTYIGQIGKSDGRKAVPELLAAFRAARLPSDRRLLLAGTQYGPYKDLVEQQYGDLIEEGRLIVVDRYLRPDEFHVANCAVDAVSVAYYTDQLSANLLAALAAERPVIGDRRGYSGMVIDTFAAGYAADIRDRPELTSAVVAAMNGAPAFQLSEKARRLLEFHRPQNFVATLLAGLYRRLGDAPATTTSWDWVLGAPATVAGRFTSRDMRSRSSSDRRIVRGRATLQERAD